MDQNPILFGTEDPEFIVLHSQHIVIDIDISISESMEIWIRNQLHPFSCVLRLEGNHINARTKD